MAVRIGKRQVARRLDREAEDAAATAGIAAC